MQRIQKLSGIYQIRNKVNNKIYIGHSINITLRWYTHIDRLMNNTHDNKKLQEDFNTYGLSNFGFSILELLDGKGRLIKKEQEYLNDIDFLDNYNIINSNTEFITASQTDQFIEYINSRWLLSNMQMDKKTAFINYGIYKEEDKQEIVNTAIKYKIINQYPSHITYNMIMNFCVYNLGYVVTTQRIGYQNRKYSYKLITR